MCNGTICEKCYPQEFCRRLDVVIAQNQRLADLIERSNGYDNPPLYRRVPSPTTATPYLLPFFETGAILSWGIFSTDGTGVNAQIFLQHPTIVLPNNRYFFADFQGTGTFNLPPGNITIPANGVFGFILNTLTGGTYASLSISYNRSDQTGIELARSQRAGRIG